MIRVYYRNLYGFTLGYTGIVVAEYLVNKYPDLDYEGRIKLAP